MARILALLLCLLPCWAFAYPQQGSHERIMRQLEAEVVGLKQGEVLIVALYEASGQATGVDVQRVCARCDNTTEKQAIDTCTRNVRAVSAKNAKFLRYDFAAAQQVRTNIVNRMRAEREVAERARSPRASVGPAPYRTGRS